MKKNLYVILPFILLLSFTSCSQKKVKPPKVKVEDNATETVATNEYDPYDWHQNDELFEKKPAEKVLVIKSKRLLVLLDKDENILSKHRISLGKNPIGPKTQQGDKKTPEGIYKIIDKRKDKKYYKELLINYPNQKDIKRAKKLGVNPGGGITIHAQVPRFWDGKGDNYTLSHDWTEGCIAITNKGISRIAPFLKPGAGVVTTRNHVQYIVTEYGVAHLYGKTIKQRIQALAEIAHPELREDILRFYYDKKIGSPRLKSSVVES